MAAAATKDGANLSASLDCLLRKLLDGDTMVRGCARPTKVVTGTSLPVGETFRCTVTPAMSALPDPALTSPFSFSVALLLGETGSNGGNQEPPVSANGRNLRIAASNRGRCKSRRQGKKRGCAVGGWHTSGRQCVSAASLLTLHFCFRMLATTSMAY